MHTRRRRILQRIILFGLLGVIANVAVAWACSWWVLPRFIVAEPMSVFTFWPRWNITAESLFENHRLFELQSVSRFEGFGVTEYAVFALPIGVSPRSPASTKRMFESDLKLKVPVDHAAQLNQIHRRNNLSSIAVEDIGLRSQLLELRTVSDLPPGLRTDAGWPMRSLRGWGPATEFIRLNPQGPANPVPLVGEWAVVGVRDGNVRILPMQPLPLGFLVNTALYGIALWMLACVPIILRRHSRINRSLCPACAYPIGASNRCSECGERVRSTPVEKQQSPQGAAGLG